MANEKHIRCLIVGRDILLAAFVGIAFCFIFVVKKNATQSTVMKVNNKRRHTHQMCANAHVGTGF